MARRLVPLLPAIVAAALYAPILGHGLSGEEFELLRGSADASVGSLLAPREAPPFPGANPYWRPLASLLHRVVLALAGGDLLRAAPFAHAASLLLHAANAAIVAALARALGLGILSSIAAGALFAVTPGPVAAVAWFGAVNKPLTGLFAFLGVAAALRYGATGRRGCLLGLLAAAGAAFGSSELAYPLVGFLPLAVAAAGPPARRRALGLLVLLAAAALAHLLLLQPSGALARGVGSGSTAALVPNLLGTFSVLVGGPARVSLLGGLLPLALFAVAAASGGRCSALAGAWLLLAPFPTVLTGVAPFHAYVAAAPGALLLGFLLSRVAGRGSGSRRLFAGAILLLLAGAGGVRVRAELRAWEAHEREVVAFARAVRCAAPDLGPEDRVRLVNVPLTFEGALLALARGRLPHVEHVNFAASPAVAFLPQGFGFRPAEGRRVVGIVRDAGGACRLLAGDDPGEGRERLAGGLVYYDAVAVGSGAEAERRLASGAVDPKRTVLVEGSGPLPSAERGFERAERVGGAASGPASLRVRFRVRAAQEAVFVHVPEIEEAPLLWFRPDPHHALLEREAAVDFPRGEARVDGAPVGWLRANGLHRAVRLPAGEHEVELLYTL